MPQWTDVGGMNEGYVLDLYERYLRDPASVDATTRAAFAAGPPAFEGLAAEPAGVPADLGPSDIRAIVGAVNLAESIRKYGHMAAQLDPLGTPHWGDPSLAPEAHGISDAELRQLPATLVGGPVAE